MKEVLQYLHTIAEEILQRRDEEEDPTDAWDDGWEDDDSEVVQ